MNKVLATTGKGSFTEEEYVLPDLTPTEITVKAVMTGVCRSDIDMMSGDFGPLPLHMQGHEGLGRVVGIGSEVSDVKVGDLVATRGEPAYADYYNVRAREYVKVRTRQELQPIQLVHQPQDRYSLRKLLATNQNQLDQEEVQRRAQELNESDLVI